MSSTYYVPSTAYGASQLLSYLISSMRKMVQKFTVESDHSSQGFPWTEPGKVSRIKSQLFLLIRANGDQPLHIYS